MDSASPDIDATRSSMAEQVTLRKSEYRLSKLVHAAFRDPTQSRSPGSRWHWSVGPSVGRSRESRQVDG